MSRLPERSSEGAGNLPDRRLSSEEFELVIRRAAELQARSAEASAVEGISEAEALRIGRELGLSGMHLHQALLEVRGRTVAERGVLDRLLGPAVVRASRTVAGAADEVRRRLEGYLLEREYLAVLRRFPDRTVFEAASGVAAAIARATGELVGRSPRLRVKNLTVAVQPLEEGFSHVSLSTELSGARAGYAAGALVGGGGAGATVAVALGIAVAPPAALLGLPVLGLAAAGARQAYSHQAARTLVRMESLLDRLEHGELPPPLVRRSGPRG